MGRVSGRGAAHLDYYAMTRYLRLLAFLALGLLLGGSFSYAFAAGTVRYELRGLNVTREGGQTHIRGTSPTESAALGVTGGVVSTVGSSMVGGSKAEFATTASLAASAASVAVSAIRLNPVGLVGSAVGAWLLGKGISYVEGAWGKQGASQPVQAAGYWTGTYVPQPYSGTFSGVVALAATRIAAANGPYNCPNGAAGTPYCPSLASLNCGGGPTNYSCYGYEGGVLVFSRTNPTNYCPTGYHESAGACFPDNYSPVSEEDWNAVKASPLPDAAAKEIIQRGGELPINPPSFEPKYKDVPLSDPYKEAASGKTVREMARVTPQPTTPETAKLEVTKQEVNPETGEPATNPETGEPQAPAAEEKDLCVDHPDISACKELDEVEDSDLPTRDDPFSLNPISGFGADTAACPAPQTLFTRGGQTVVWEWTKFCQFSQGIRPLVIGFAWLAALAMVVAVGRRS